MPVKARTGGQGRVRTGRVGGQTGSGGSPAAPAASDWFVDSVAGSDANNGTTSSTPFQTLAALATAITANPTKTTVSLKRGSRFRESLSGSVTAALDFGSSSSALPIIDGSDVITGWTVNGTQASVWEKTVTIPTGGRPRVFEDGSLMKWVADLATCATTAGSRVLLDEGGTITLQIHPSDGGNPNTNGKIYEATTRLSPVLLGNGCTLKGIHAQRAISNNGAIEMGRDSYLERCLAVDGSKHNMLVGGGTLVDVIAVRTDDLTPAQPAQAYIVGFGGAGGIAGQSFNMVRCGVVSDRAGVQLGVAFIDHGSGTDAYDSVNITQGWAVDCQSDYQAASKALNINGYYVENVSSFLNSFSDEITVSNALIHLTLANNLGAGRSRLGFSSTFFAHFTDLAFYAPSSVNGLLRFTSDFNGGDFRLTNATIYCAAPGQIILSDGEGWSAGSLEMNGNIFISLNAGSVIQVPSGVTYTGDHNAFAGIAGSGVGESFKYHGSSLTGLAAWKTASLQDSVSVEFDPTASAIFPGAGVANGDFRLGGGTNAAPLKTAGSGGQNHWDWNARVQVSGAPARWPIVPRTLADSLAYAKNPAAWDWGTDSTLPVDSTPDSFSFTPVTGAPISTTEDSNTITISGMDTGVSVSVSITGGLYSKNGGAFTSSSGSAVNGDTFKARQTSSGSIGTTTNAVLTIGGVSGTFAVTTAGGAIGILLMENGTDHLLMENGTDKILMEA